MSALSDLQSAVAANAIVIGEAKKKLDAARQEIIDLTAERDALKSQLNDESALQVMTTDLVAAYSQLA